MIVSAGELMPVIRSALKRGQRVRMTVSGSSMLPFIRSGDEVELEPVLSQPDIGDVILAQRDDERYVLHRVIRVEGEGFFLRGDGQRNCEGPFALRKALGKVTTAYHKGRPRTIDKGLWHMTAVLWTRCTPLSLHILSAVIQVWRLSRRIFGGPRRPPSAESGCKGRENC